MEQPDSKPCGACASWRGQRILVGLLLAAAGIAVYWPAAGYDFIEIDDHVYFGENKHVLAGLTWSNLVWAFQTTLDASWYPLSWLSFMLDAELFGSGPGGPHVTNVLLHVANCILLFLLFERMTKATWCSALVAGLFALHPLHVESVAWVSERKDVLSTLFGLLTLLVYVRYAAKAANNFSSGALAYFLALFLFALGLLSKPMLVTLPLVMLLLDYWPLRRIGALDPSGPPSNLARLLLEKAPFLVLSAMVSIITVVVHKQAGAIAPLSSASIWDRVGNAFVSYARYLGKTIWPTDLAIPYLHSGHWPLGQVALAVSLVVGFTAVAAWLGRRKPYLLVGWAWFLGTLIPVIGLVQWGNQSMADRFMYLPSIGLFIALAWGLRDLLGRWRLPRAAVGAIAILALVALALRSGDQLRYWRNSETLFRHTLEVTTDNFIALDCLGSVLDKRGKHEEALRLFSQSVRLQPRYPEAQYDLGSALLKAGRLDEAVAHLEAALKLNPAFAHAHINLGKALLEQGKLDQAAVSLSQAIRLTPEDPEAQYNLGTVLLMQSKQDAAIACFSEALRLRPDYGEAHGNLGVALMKQGKPGQGAAHLNAALRLSPENPQAHDNLGLALLELNRPGEAARLFAEALRLTPQAPGPHYHLALALVRQDKVQEAMNHARTARDLATAAGQAALAAKAEELLRQHP